ncbi:MULTISPECIES: hypothetical protein [unclassified Kocuria]|uniref:hypothetical protein n=1 Tax=unclassified Kocuria TaxID=2649579 RepID=UPI00288316A2|nr:MULTISPECIES: hypothetical protein [unclassified Kocuria]
MSQHAALSRRSLVGGLAGAALSSIALPAAAAELFQRKYLARSQGGQAPLELPHVFTAAVSTGVGSGLDLNGDGRLGTGDDAWGFGLFPGQYGMVVYSALPIDRSAVRTFQHQLWSQMLDSLLPWDHYAREIGQRLRLSSKSHWDIPVRAGRDTIHVLASYPTPPSFDGPTDSNGRRNHDEIRFWADCITVRSGRTCACAEAVPARLPATGQEPISQGADGLR